MGRLLFSLLVLFFIYTDFSDASSCADSVTIQYYFHHTSNSNSYTINVDTFDLDSGFVKSCQSVSSNPNSVPFFYCTMGYWVKDIVTLNVSGDTTEILKQTGSVAGWINLSHRVFNYDPVSGYKLSESNEIWNGGSWDQTDLHLWIYNVNNQLIEETTQTFSGGFASNILRVIWYYSGNILNSKMIQKGNGNTWVNDKKYNFINDINGIRDSVRYSEWDTLISTWNVFGTSPYYFNQLKLADFIIVKQVNFSGYILNDSISFSIDTLENFIYHYELSPTSTSATEDDYSMDILTYEYVNNKYLIKTSYSSDWWIDHSWPGLNWICTWDDQENTYDSLGYLILNTQAARCVMPRLYTTNYYYNSNHLLIREAGWLDSNTLEDRYTIDNYFATADSVICYIHPWHRLPFRICRNDNFTVPIAAAGGCGAYSFSWSPGTGLSAVNISDPLITVHDSVLYTITVTDSIGQTGSTQLPVYPQILFDITIDSSACAGCPMILSATYSPDYSYSWYYNGNYITNSDTSSITAAANGSYSVTVSRLPNYLCNYIGINLLTLNSDDLNAADLNLYPNPTSEMSRLSFNNNVSGNIRISINNMTGAEILLYEGIAHNNFSFLLNGSEYGSGIYVVTVKTDKGVKRLKWIIGQ